MANIFELKYHDDTVKKRSITNEEISFLKELQKEMNTQDTVCQADPRYWVICGTEKVYGAAKDCSEGYEFSNDGFTLNSMEEIAGFIRENVLNQDKAEGDSFEETISYEWLSDTIEIETEDDIITLVSPEETAEWLNEKGYDFSVSYYRNERIFYPGTVFLTHRDAMEHLKSNQHHYSSDAHTYAMTAFRSPSVEKLYKLIQEVDLEEMTVSK